jgi:hypothetical protein
MVKCLWEVLRVWSAAAQLPLFYFKAQWHSQTHLHPTRILHPMNPGCALFSHLAKYQTPQVEQM